MAPRHTAAPAIVGARRAVAFGDVGGSGLIVVVIVAAWALFLVPQWMHRRASAAQHLADRIPSTDDSEQRETASRRFGRRELSRSPRVADDRGGLLSRWHLPAVPSLRRSKGADDGYEAADTADPSGTDDGADVAVTMGPPTPRSAAARRRRVLTVLALATLLTAAFVGVAAVAGLPVPAWLVAVPGGLMVAYLVLLAVVRPGARGVSEPVRHRGAESSAATLAVEVDAVLEGEHVGVAAIESSAVASPAPAVPAAPVSTGSDSTWTPVPLPTPTYVTAPRARTVRTIDLSNPGSWTAAPAASTEHAAPAVPAHAAADDHGAEHVDDYLIEHRRAVGD